ncbi:hypothetical protein Ddye_015223 [Dipteronia dyeriana]|uniref:FBD domain-containing protein n=1 Tax=Dipteronia dyeriana TaxID=168575 RepID=A0AAD9U5I5_9ROSI|nr:hypothetical protein Ddye_015223 [Dipteronia dyeriana]
MDYRRDAEKLETTSFEIASSNHTPIRLPHCLVTCGSLVELKLQFKDQSCVVELPIYPEFSSLKCLDLHMIEFLDSNLLKNFISICPVIESLKMESCLFGDFKILEIFSTSLKNLILDTGDFSEPNCDGLANCEIKVACPSLVSFYFYTASTWNFTFQDLNSLQAGFISYCFPPKHATSEECHYVMSKILKGLHNVQVLKLPVGFLRFLPLTVAKPECSAAFCSLKSLKLLVSVDESDQSTIQLLYRCPNLEALSIIFTRLEDWVDGAIPPSAIRPTWVICGKSIPLTDSCKMPNEDISCLTYHLKKVELINVAYNKNELELVKFLLNNGHVLQKMIIKGRRFENHDKIISKVMMFPRSSPDVVLKFYEPAI